MIYFIICWILFGMFGTIYEHLSGDDIKVKNIPLLILTGISIGPIITVLIIWDLIPFDKVIIKRFK